MSATAAVMAAGRRRTRRAGRAWLVALALPALLVGAYVTTNVQASLAQRDLRDRWEATLEATRGIDPVAAARHRYAPGDPVARLVVPAIGLDAIVVEGADPTEMRRGPAHLPLSAIPGEDGIAILTGNRFGFGGFFADVDRLRPGDRIRVETIAGAHTFVVRSVDVVPVERLDLRTTGTGPALVLFASARRWGGADRIVIRAEEAA